MTATAHALVGGAIAASVNNPVLGITLATISHPFLDMVPHWDFGWGWRNKTKTKLFVEASADALLGIGLSYFLFGQHIQFWYFSAAVFMSLAWDLAEIPYWFLNYKKAPISWIYQLQHNIQGKTKTMMAGILTQVATVTLVFMILRSFPNKLF